LLADLAASLLLCLISYCPVEVQPIAACRRATKVLLTGYWTCDVTGSFSVKKSWVWNTVFERKWIPEIIGVLKGTLSNAYEVEVVDGDIMDVSW